MSIPPPTRGMMVELHGGQKDGERVRYIGPRLRVPVLGPVRIVVTADALPIEQSYRIESFTLRQSQPDGHWFYVLDR